MAPFEFATPRVAARGDRAARSGRSGHSSGGRGHRRNFDDEGGRTATNPVGQPARHRAALRANSRRRTGRTAPRRPDASHRAGAFAGRQERLAGAHTHAAHLVQRARAQRGDDRRQSRPRRPAHGLAAGAQRARRPSRYQRPAGRAHAALRAALHRLLRDGAGAQRTDLRSDRAAAGHTCRGLPESHHAGRRTTGRPWASPWCSRWTACR